jgi:hypothetical protein
MAKKWTMSVHDRKTALNGFAVIVKYFVWPSGPLRHDKLALLPLKGCLAGKSSLSS